MKDKKYGAFQEVNELARDRIKVDEITIKIFIKKKHDFFV